MQQVRNVYTNRITAIIEISLGLPTIQVSIKEPLKTAGTMFLHSTSILNLQHQNESGKCKEKIQIQTHRCTL